MVRRSRSGPSRPAPDRVGARWEAVGAVLVAGQPVEVTVAGHPVLLVRAGGRLRGLAELRGVFHALAS